MRGFFPFASLEGQNDEVFGWVRSISLGWDFLYGEGFVRGELLTCGGCGGASMIARYDEPW